MHYSQIPHAPELVPPFGPRHGCPESIITAIYKQCRVGVLLINQNMYYEHVRMEHIEDILPGDNRILDVGCAEGSTCLEMKNRGLASETVGIELDQASASVAAERLGRVICGDIEQLDFQKEYL